MYFCTGIFLPGEGRGVQWLRLFTLGVSFLVSFHATAQLPAGFIRERIATGLNPTSMVIGPDGRIFITEKNGTIRIVREDQLLDEPFLHLEVDDSNERGLGHMVLHPDFETNGYFYIFYAVQGGRHNRISRFTANGDKAIPGSEVVIMDLDELGSDIHNGGDMVFGFDGYLYVSTGDGGQNWNGDDLGSTNGKILRMDDSGHPVPDNPWYYFNYRRANFVYAYGFRNPFTMTRDPVSGAIYANDVGFGKYEEINKIEMGAFYGWPVVEGKKTSQDVPANYQDPLYAYPHAFNYCAIVGSAIYDPPVQQFPSQYAGKYFYSDYCTGHMHVLNPETGADEGIFMGDGDRVVDIDVSASGHLYYLERKGLGDGSVEDNTSTTMGTLWKVTYTGSGIPFISVQPEDQLAAEGESVTFHISAYGAAPLAYHWRVNEQDIAGNDFDEYTFPSVLSTSDSTRIQVSVSNTFGEVYSQVALLRVTTNHRPQLTIVQPLEGSTYTAGTELKFSGFAEDLEDGLLPSGQLSWKIDFHHGTHSHPAMSWTSGISSGTYTIASTGETSDDVWYRIYLSATDQEGLTAVTHRDVYPEFGTVQVHSTPEGLKVGLDGYLTQTPFLIHGVEGVNRYLTPQRKQVSGDSVYFFNGWLDGSHELNREIQAMMQEQEFNANYSAIYGGKGTGLTASYYDNPDWEGDPVAVELDPVIDHNYFSGSPYPGVPEDYFSIAWNGYIQALRSGEYVLRVFSDDGMQLEWNGMPVIDNLEQGFHNESVTVFMQQGYLYPIRLRLREEAYSSQIRLRWSSSDFDEEIVPTAQLYPESYLRSPDYSALQEVTSLTDQEIGLSFETYKPIAIHLEIVDAKGATVTVVDHEFPGGKSTFVIPISFLPPGMYFLRTKYKDGHPDDTYKFVKPR